MPLQSPVWQYSNIGIAGMWFPYRGEKRNQWLSGDVSASGRILEAYSLEGTVRFRYPSAFALTTFTEVNTNIAATTATVRYRIDNSILLVTLSGSTIYRQTTNDEGTTFSVAMSVMDGSNPAVCVHPVTGNEVHFCFKASGAIATKVLSPTGTVSVAEREVVAAGVAAVGALTCFIRYGVAYLVYKSASGTITTVSSSNLLQYL